MIYTPAEKEKLDKVFAAFQDYIQQHTCFDILYSDKIGYIQLLTEYPEDGGEFTVIDSAKDLMEILFLELAMDLLSAESTMTHMSSQLSEAQEHELRNRVKQYLKPLGREAGCYLELFEYFLEQFDKDINWELREYSAYSEG